MEEETDEIAHTIQVLLQSMRLTSTSGYDLQRLIRQVTDRIDGVIFESDNTIRETMDRGIVDEAMDTLSRLSLARDTMDSLADSVVEDSSNKAIKQKIANTSYEIAKHAKELLGFLE